MAEWEKGKNDVPVIFPVFDNVCQVFQERFLTKSVIDVLQTIKTCPILSTGCSRVTNQN